MTPDSVLVYGPNWIGDAVMSLGALRVLRKELPSARLTVLARGWVRELYAGCEAVDETIGFDPRGDERGVRGFLRAVRRLRRESFDVAVLFPNAFRATALIYAAGIPERWGYATEGRAALLTRSVPPPPRPFGRHQAYFYLDLIASLGLGTGEPDLSLTATTEMKAAAIELLRSHGWRGGPLVGVHPGATNSRAKIWSPKRFAEAATRLSREHDGAQVVVLGGPAEVELAGALVEAMGCPAIELQGQTSLRELIGVLSQLAVFLTNDSGPMHLAAALGAPTVAVFGPTDERETGPFSERARVVREQVDCSPCLYRDCPIDHRCMERVPADRVVEEARLLLGREEAVSP